MGASETTKGAACAAVEEALAQVVDGTAPAELYEHVAECDACRDLRHEATLAAERVAGAGADFRPAADFVSRLQAKLAEAPAPTDGASRGGADGGGAAEAATAAPSEKAAPARADEPAPGAAPAASAPSPVTAVTRTEPAGAAPAGEPVAPTTAAEPEPALGSGASTRKAPEPKGAAAARVAAPSGGEVVPFVRRPAFAVVAALAVVGAAAAGLWLERRGVQSPGTAAAEAPWSGKLTRVSRASADANGGVEACAPKGGRCAPVAADAPIEPGTTLKTDARTRAFVALADGTEIAIDRASTLELDGRRNRTARLVDGMIVADIAKVEGAPAARFSLAQGEVEVLGTKIALTALHDRATVEVARGAVRVTGERGAPLEVRAGEEVTLERGREPRIATTSSLSSTLEWSDRSPEEADGPVLRGLGELRARKPGQTQEKGHAVRLARHAVKARIVDVVARTEVDETFTNDTDEELEGIFRFPLPPGAQIERLALEVDGKLVDGAFVDRDKGAAIWRGVIQNAAPKAPKPLEEILWVPGPWRDPALLEWQRGGRFELKIFPIPKRGSRRVVLAYTQLVPQEGGIRRYTYPLAHDPSGTTKVDAFDLDLQVLGGDPSFGVSARGYELAPAQGGDAPGDRRTFHAQGFVPAGDLTVEYALADRDHEVTAWAYRAADAPAPIATPAPAGGKAKTAEEKAAADAALAMASDGSPYVAIALRPALPRWREAKERLHVVVVDASRSMVGERFSRATRLASSIVREMDRRDAFVLLACDTSCRAMPAREDGAPSASARGLAPAAARSSVPGPAAADEVERFLGRIEPDGGSDLAGAMLAARSAAGSLGGRELRVLYLGDGTPTVGPTRPGHLEAAVRGALPAGEGAVVAVGLGADADVPSLEALARGGGGVVVPYVPGQRVGSAALDVLAAAYGVVLRDPVVELPDGLTQVTPSRLDPIRAGSEAFVVARMSGDHVGGTLKLRGRVAGEAFERSYPLELTATTNGGNAFVPRLFAAARIAELERAGGDAQKAAAIELSRRFAVASRYTSLLVLESEAMYSAFGLERARSIAQFTGEQQAQSSTADSDAPREEGEAEEKDALDTRGAEGHGLAGLAGGAGKGADMGGASIAAPLTFSQQQGAARSAGPSATAAPAGAAAAAPAAEAPAPKAAPPIPRDLPNASPWASGDDFKKKENAYAEPPSTPPAPRRPAKIAGAPGDPLLDWTPPPRRPPRRMIPMRKVWDRKAAFDPGNALAVLGAPKLAAAEGALGASPDSRDRTVELFGLYATAGRLAEAQALATKWAGRDALDPDALLARADLAARQGDRERAIRVLGGLVDVRPAGRAAQTRLAALYDAAGDPALACEHRIALADLAPSEPKLVADAVTCSRARGMSELASLLEGDAPAKARDAIARLVAAAPAGAVGALRGDVQLTAEWSGGVDLDVALVDAQGRRISWLGAPGKVAVTARDATSGRTETVALSGLPAGSYVLEVSRASTSDGPSDVVHGEVTLRLVGETRKVPFTLSGPRAELGTVRVFFTSRLVPVEGLVGPVF